MQQNLESLPTPYLALTIDTVAVSLHKSRLHRTSEVPTKKLEELRCGGDLDVDESEPKDTSFRRTSEERIRKAEGSSTAVPLGTRRGSPGEGRW